MNSIVYFPLANTVALSSSVSSIAACSHAVSSDSGGRAMGPAEISPVLPDPWLQTQRTFGRQLNVVFAATRADVVRNRMRNPNLAKLYSFLLDQSAVALPLLATTDRFTQGLFHVVYTEIPDVLAHDYLRFDSALCALAQRVRDVYSSVHAAVAECLEARKQSLAQKG
jgi:hypothetical protein